MMHSRALAQRYGNVASARGRPVTRREFMTALGGAAVWPVSAHPQQPRRVRRIGVLSAGDPSNSLIAHFQRGLYDLGYSEGRNFVLQIRHAAGQYDRFDGLAA